MKNLYKSLISSLLIFGSSLVAADSTLPVIPSTNVAQISEVDTLLAEINANNTPDETVIPRAKQESKTDDPGNAKKNASLPELGVHKDAWLEDRIVSRTVTTSDNSEFVTTNSKDPQKSASVPAIPAMLSPISSGKLPSADDYVLDDASNQQNVKQVISKSQEKANNSNSTLVKSEKASPFGIAQGDPNFIEGIDDNPNISVANINSSVLNGNTVTDQELASNMQAVGGYVKGYVDSDDKEDYVKNSLSSYLAGTIDTSLNQALESYNGVHAQISLGLGNIFESTSFRPSGKILLPLYNEPANITFVQTGITRGSGSRDLLHFGIGTRWFPQASSKSELGSYMLGLNAVADLDLSRGHKRLSLGGEFVNENLAISANLYRRMSGWKGSFDFESDYVQERPASGFDIRSKFFVPRKAGLGQLAVTASVTHWIGDDIAPFGTTSSTSDLENNPWIYALGLQWQVVPAFNIELKHEVTNQSHHNSYFGINFNIPLGTEYSYKDAFNPDKTNLASGLSLDTYRSAFIDRDYTMPLQYRATPDKFHIKYCGLKGDNSYCFQLTDGLGRHPTGYKVVVTPEDKCVKMSDNGVYYTNSEGMITATIIAACKNKTVLHVEAGGDSADFEVVIQKLTLSISAKPEQIARYQSSTVSIFAKFDGDAGLEGTQYRWYLDNEGTGENQTGTLVGEKENDQWSNNTAQIKFAANPNAKQDYDATIHCEVYGQEFTTTVHVKVYDADGKGFKLSIGDDRNYIEGYELLYATYADLEPYSSITWSSGESAILSAKSDLGENGYLADSANEVTIKDEDGDGVIKVFIQGKDIQTADHNPTSVEIKAQTADPNIAPTKSLDVVSYIPTQGDDDVTSVEPDDTFLVTIKDLKNSDVEPNKAVQYVEFAKTATISGGSKVVTIDETFNGGSNRVEVVNGQAQMRYVVPHDAYYTGEIRDLTAIYYRNVGKTSEQFNFKTVSIAKHEPKLYANFYRFSEGDIVPLTVQIDKGLDKQEITWSKADGVAGYFCTENGEKLSNTTTYFNSNGLSTIYFKGGNGAKNSHILIKAETLGEVLDTDSMDSSGIDPNTGKQNSSSGDNNYNVWDTSSLDEIGTLNYKEQRELTLKDLKPNSEITLTIKNEQKVDNSGNSIDSAITLSSGSNSGKTITVTTDSNGNITDPIVINGIDNFNVKEFDVEVTYHKTTESTDTTSKHVTMQTYTLVVTSGNLVPFANNDIRTSGSTTVEVSGGFAGEKFELVVSGDASFSADAANKVTSITDSFGADGKKTVTLYSFGTFTTAPTLIAKSMSRESATTEVIYTKTALNPVINLPSMRADHLYVPNTSDYVDFNSTGSFTVSNLLKHSTITANIANFDSVTCNEADDTGTATCNFSAYKTVKNNTSKVASENVNVTYIDPAKDGYKNTTATNATVTPKTLNIYEYALSVTQSATEIYGDEEYTVTVSGAMPGDHIDFTITGHGAFSNNTQSLTNQSVLGNGTCTVKVHGISPYTEAIKVTATSHDGLD